VQDTITPPDASHAMGRLIAGSKVVEIPDCGHLSTLEQPGETSRLMREWLFGR
jgi:pimeloyl-ACP methyl ester carboxylesterase